MFEYWARVKRVVDGDTVDFEVDLGFGIMTHIRGRLQGVDTPERGETDYYKATEMCGEFLKASGSLVGDTPETSELWIPIKTHKTGKYGRWIVEIKGVTDKLAEIWPYGG